MHRFGQRQNCHDSIERLLSLSLFFSLVLCRIADKIAKQNVSRGQKSRAEEARGSTICAAVQTVRTAKILPRHPFLKYPESSGILMPRHGGTVHNVHTRAQAGGRESLTGRETS